MTRASSRAGRRVRRSFRSRFGPNGLRCPGNDTVAGNDGNDYIYGGSDNDWLVGDDFFGGTGNDQIYGQDGNDVLIGGPGKDILSGGSGKDDFEFDALDFSLSNPDHIIDFTAFVQRVVGAWDRIDVGGPAGTVSNYFELSIGYDDGFEEAKDFAQAYIGDDTRYRFGDR